MKIEEKVTQNGLVRNNNHRIFRPKSALNALFGGSGIDDDHKPFERRGVPILHIIASPFPRVWHTMNDNANAIDYEEVEKLNTILRIFVSDWEYISVPMWVYF